jgi:hypothetical protein
MQSKMSNDPLNQSLSCLPTAEHIVPRGRVDPHIRDQSHTDLCVHDPPWILRLSRRRRSVKHEGQSQSGEYVRSGAVLTLPVGHSFSFTTVIVSSDIA